MNVKCICQYLQGQNKKSFSSYKKRSEKYFTSLLFDREKAMVRFSIFWKLLEHCRLTLIKHYDGDDFILQLGIYFNL
jgi:hypothetical protein